MTTSGSDAVAADSLEGVVRIVGVEEMPRTMLVPDDGSRSIELAGVPLLSKVAGLRVAVLGTRSGGRMDVSRFHVVAANGVRAADGVLIANGSAFVLVMPSGARLSVARPSPGLRALVGHRVWISGDLAGETVAYGVID
jgi:hypothetical protein